MIKKKYIYSYICIYKLTKRYDTDEKENESCAEEWELKVKKK